MLTRAWASRALRLQYSLSRHQVGNNQEQPCLDMLLGSTENTELTRNLSEIPWQSSYGGDCLCTCRTLDRRSSL